MVRKLTNLYSLINETVNSVKTCQATLTKPLNVPSLIDETIKFVKCLVKFVKKRAENMEMKMWSLNSYK